MTGRHEGAEADARGVAREGGEREPGVGRAGKAVAVERHVVIGAEEGVEAELLAEAGERRELGVVRALLGLGEDSQAHGRTLPPRRPPLRRDGDPSRAGTPVASP